MDQLANPDVWIALATLSAMEIVLGIDNIVFISILCGRLPEDQRASTRRLGILAALVMRLGLLFTISWIMRLTEPLFEVWGRGLSGKDLILLGGGLFLIFKATKEIHHKLEGERDERDARQGGVSRGWIILQIMVIDIVFSLDSVITAVGMANQIWVMATAMIIAVVVMLVSAGAVAGFVDRHPSVKMLALSFLLLIGVMLVAEGFHEPIQKGYIYFAMGFSLFVEALNIRRTRNVRPVEMRASYRLPTVPPAGG